MFLKSLFVKNVSKKCQKIKKIRILQHRVISNIILFSFYNQTFRVSPQAIFFSVLMNYSWTKTLVQEQFAWNLSSCLTKIWISPTLQVGWSGLPKHQLMLDFIFPPNLSELPFLVIPMIRPWRGYAKFIIKKLRSLKSRHSECSAVIWDKPYLLVDCLLVSSETQRKGKSMC